MYVCMYLCMYVCMYVHVYVYVYVYVYKEGPQARHWLMLPNQALFLSPTSVCGGPQT